MANIDLSDVSREDLEKLLIETTKAQNILFEDNQSIKLELGAFKLLTSELEQQVEEIDTAKKQSDRGLDLQIKRVSELENALKEKDKYITFMEKVIKDNKIDTSSLDKIREIHRNQITSLNNTINAFRYNEEGAGSES